MPVVPPKFSAAAERSFSGTSFRGRVIPAPLVTVASGRAYSLRLWANAIRTYGGGDAFGRRLGRDFRAGLPCPASTVRGSLDGEFRPTRLRRRLLFRSLFQSSDASRSVSTTRSALDTRQAGLRSVVPGVFIALAAEQIPAGGEQTGASRRRISLTPHPGAQYNDARPGPEGGPACC